VASAVPFPWEPVKHTVSFDVFMNPDGQVEQVALRDSTFHTGEVVACMGNALYAVSERALDASLRRREPASPASLPPETRVLFAHPVAIGVSVIELGLVVGLMAITVVVYFQVVRNTQPHRPPPPAVVEDPPKPEPPKPEPQTKVDPKTTDPPPPPPPAPPRRYPKQTCDDGELDRLENEKKRLCNGGYAANCSESKVNKEKLERTPCSAIKRSIEQRLACLSARTLVQEQCFGGVPDAGHKNAIDEVQNGINKCEALKLINCAKGHPQAGF
jgi:hypothetical protein